VPRRRSSFLSKEIINKKKARDFTLSIR
jgi:hypothetical protein